MLSISLFPTDSKSQVTAFTVRNTNMYGVHNMNLNQGIPPQSHTLTTKYNAIPSTVYTASVLLRGTTGLRRYGIGPRSS